MFLYLIFMLYNIFCLKIVLSCYKSPSDLDQLIRHEKSKSHSSSEWTSPTSHSSSSKSPPALIKEKGKRSLLLHAVHFHVTVKHTLNQPTAKFVSPLVQLNNIGPSCNYVLFNSSAGQQREVWVFMHLKMYHNFVTVHTKCMFSIFSIPRFSPPHLMRMIMEIMVWIATMIRIHGTRLLTDRIGPPQHPTGWRQRKDLQKFFTQFWMVVRQLVLTENIRFIWNLWLKGRC